MDTIIHLLAKHDTCSDVVELVHTLLDGKALDVEKSLYRICSKFEWYYIHNSDDSSDDDSSDDEEGDDVRALKTFMRCMIEKSGLSSADVARSLMRSVDKTMIQDSRDMGNLMLALSVIRKIEGLTLVLDVLSKTEYDRDMGALYNIMNQERYCDHTFFLERLQNKIGNIRKISMGSPTEVVESLELAASLLSRHIIDTAYEMDFADDTARILFCLYESMMRGAMDDGKTT